ncbi:PREDICTED: undifferentiated embryonic cell transcription factor 1 [Dipodomys ordii]|uniref:Undifferentiated embryonic cell transcription factor 1 n=1 Tax=Dipodomys ordii TaxID=10020 RepID=A0A1S3GVR1_DIPOR|nr:PREDICTED: undifferentiated embryonic cell transcription factor 1 [Dipodomys ordii]
MLLRPRRPPPLAPRSPTDLVAELLPLAKDAPGTPPRGLAATKGGSPLRPGAPVSPGSAQHEPWSAWETELLLAELLRPAVWRHKLPTYRQVSAALALRQVRRTPAQCCRRYKFLKSKVCKATGQPPGPFDAQIRELMGLLGDDQQDRRACCRRPAPSVPPPVPEEPGRQAAGQERGRDCRARGRWRRGEGQSGREAGRGGRGRRLRGQRAGGRAAAPADPVLPPAGATLPWAPANLLPPAPTPSLNAALLQTLTHLGDIVGMLGLLQDQLLSRNQHVEQLRGSFDQTVSLAVGFILGSMATQRGVLGEPS